MLLKHEIRSWDAARKLEVNLEFRLDLGGGVELKAPLYTQDTPMPSFFPIWPPVHLNEVLVCEQQFLVCLQLVLNTFLLAVE